MKYLLLLYVSFISINAYCQTPAEINKVVGLPDSLTFKNEIRVYKDRGISNLTQVFRLYEAEENLWKAELYNYTGQQNSDKEILNAKKQYISLWIDILNTNVAYLPEEQAILYKLRGKLEFADKNDVYGSRKITQMLDGTGYEIFISGEGVKNHINYSNPESYLKCFPGVDELESIVALINIIRGNFNIWMD
jgi:hypothetical protein